MRTGFFTYQCWEDEKSNDAELWHHTRQLCEILYELPDLDEADIEALGGVMYHIRFADGFEGDAFNDEIAEIE